MCGFKSVSQFFIIYVLFIKFLGAIVGVQHWEAAVGGSRKEENQAGVRAEREASGRPQENVLFLHSYQPTLIMFWAEGQFLCVTLHLPWDLSLTSMCIPCHREYSTQLNASRLKLLQAQDDLVRKMKEAAEKQLQKVGSAENDDYPKLLEALIIQVCTPWS